ncbi:MAG: hypothetical protein WC882_01570 [Candidatus Gracilibacteria bacterium]
MSNPSESFEKRGNNSAAQEFIRSQGVEFTIGLDQPAQILFAGPKENAEDVAYRFYKGQKGYPPETASRAAKTLMFKFGQEANFKPEDLERRGRGLNLQFKPGAIALVLNPRDPSTWVIAQFPEELNAKRVQATQRRGLKEKFGANPREKLSTEIARISHFARLLTVANRASLESQLGIPSNAIVTTPTSLSLVREGPYSGWQFINLNVMFRKNAAPGKVYSLGLNPKTGRVIILDENNKQIREGQLAENGDQIINMPRLFEVVAQPKEPLIVRAKRELSELLRKALGGKSFQVYDASNPYFNLGAYQIRFEGGKTLYVAAQPNNSFDSKKTAFRVTEGTMTGKEILPWTTDPNRVNQTIQMEIGPTRLV